ncbi:hypothetical protein [Streptomyces sp. NPDC004629]|uniref:hypothetical protein n=1 Tax=Streptomyces sp. NPDC004629 TaxID=3364705 RepID=UPI0036B47579
MSEPFVMPAGGWHPAGLANPNIPWRYVRSRTGLLHLRAQYGVVEDDGLSKTMAACGVEGSSIYVTPAIGPEGRPLCKRCVRTVA